MATDEDESIKKEFVEAYFEDLERKVAFLGELEELGHEEEAQLLGLLYIEGIANWMRHPQTNSAQNFATIVIDHGEDDQLHLVIPYWLLNALPWNSAPRGVETRLRTALADIGLYEAKPATEILTLLENRIEPGDIAWLTPEVWRGTVANAVYVTLRSPGVHKLMSGHGLSFSDSTSKGKVLRRVGLERILAVLASVVAHAKRVSLETNKWFGVH